MPPKNWQDSPQWQHEFDRMQAQQDAGAEAQHQSFVKAADEAAKQYGHPEAYDKIIKLFDNEYPNYKKEVKQAQQAYAQTSDRPAFEASIKQAKLHTTARLKKGIDGVNGGGTALTHVYQEQEGEGPFAFLVKTVFNSKRGGLQIGGVIGALVGGALTFDVTNGYGWLVNGLATALGTAIFSYLGNQYIDGARNDTTTPSGSATRAASSPSITRNLTPEPAKHHSASHPIAHQSSHPHEHGRLSPATTPPVAGTGPELNPSQSIG